MRSQAVLVAATLSVAVLISACGGGGSGESTVAAVPATTSGTPIAGLQGGIVAVLTAGVPTNPEDAIVVGTVLSFGGIEINEIVNVGLTEEQRRDGLESQARARSGQTEFTVTVYTTSEEAASALPDVAESAIVRCGRVLVVMDDSAAGDSLADRVLDVMEDRYGPCER